jgi:single-strand DNA-binding protein
MSLYMNEVNLIGFVGNDAQPAHDDAPARVSIATKRSWQDAQQQWQSLTEWHDVVAWNGTATVAAQLKKGNHVRVVGELRSREWETDAGVKQRSYEIVGELSVSLRDSRGLRSYRGACPISKQQSPKTYLN